MQKYEIIPDDRTPGSFKVKTLSYEYNIERKKDKQEVVCSHWEGDAARNPIPHIHIGSITVAANAPLSNKTHIPSGRVSVEDVVSFLIKEMGVKPTKNRHRDWSDRESARALFYRFKRW